jgi:hypothetical protein
MIARLVIWSAVTAVVVILGWMAIVDAAVWEVEHRYEQVRQLKGSHPQP